MASGVGTETGHAVVTLETFAVVEVEDDLIAGLQLVEAPEVGVVARAVPGDDDVAELARHRRARPVTGPVVERVDADALDER